jgi:arylsulfatase A-like enzyme
VPLVVSWKGTIAPGQVRHDFVDHTDLFATMLDVAGVRADPAVALDGCSLVPVLLRAERGRKAWAFSQYLDRMMIRDARWLYQSDGALFDMTDAPIERPARASPQAAAARRRLAGVLGRVLASDRGVCQDAAPGTAALPFRRGKP